MRISKRPRICCVLGWRRRKDHYPRGLPNVEVERNQMVRLFENLVGNALKFSKKGEPPHVHVSAERKEKNGSSALQITASGSRRTRPRLFEPFRRLHGARGIPGCGIGLAACKRIVQRYNGRIGADSAPGRGSTFWFTIPVSGPDQERFDTKDIPLSV